MTENYLHCTKGEWIVTLLYNLGASDGKAVSNTIHSGKTMTRTQGANTQTTNFRFVINYDLCEWKCYDASQP